MLRKYEMELDELKHPLMVEESSYECPDERLNSPEKIGKLMKIQLVDFIIIGNGYFSYAEEKRI